MNTATWDAGAERLGAGFLGREAFGVGGGPLLPAVSSAALDIGEDTLREAVAEFRQRLLDAPDITHVLADADDHA